MTRQSPARLVFLVAGIVAIGYAGFGYAAESVWQAWHKCDFEKKLALRAPAAPGADAAERGPLSGKLEIARLGIDAMVTEGDDDRTLALAVGHIPSTGLPGRAGNVGLAAHRDRLFRNRKDIRESDRITLSTISGDYVYSVLWSKIVRPSDVSVLAPTAGEETLTLVTCYPFYFVGDAPFRFIVRARRSASRI
jgi:sortase A